MAVAVEKSWPYDIGVGASVTQDEWNELIRALMAPGVVANVLNEYDATLTGALQITVDMGESIAEGTMHRLEGAPIAFDVAPRHLLHPRKDRIVVHMDRDTGDSHIMYLQGVAAAVPVAPALTQTPDGVGVYEIPLYLLDVPAVAGAMTMTDERIYAVACMTNITTMALRPSALGLARVTWLTTDNNILWISDGALWIPLVGVQSSLAGARPAANTIGPRVFWYSTDTNDFSISDGAQWLKLNSLKVYVDSVLIGTRPTLNLYSGVGISLNPWDDPGNNRISMTIDNIDKFLFGSGGDDTGSGGSVINGTVTMTADIYSQQLTVNGTLITNGYRIFTEFTIIMGPGAAIKFNGHDAAGNVPATSLPGGTIGGGAGGGNDADPGLGGHGGNGGGQVTGKGLRVFPTTNNGGGMIAHDLYKAYTGRDLGGNVFKGGAGGGQGIYGGNGTPGAGGGGAGTMVIMCFAWQQTSGTSVIEARGGRGGDAAGATANGGGGGGGGGYILFVTKTRGDPTGKISISCPGGLGGNGSSGGAGGSVGSNGVALAITPDGAYYF